MEDVKELFKKHDALLHGHFLLSSGLHSDYYFQAALVLQYPKIAQDLGRMIAEKAAPKIGKIDVVVSPAVGGIVLGHEVARALDARAIFLERVDKKLTLRRGFSINYGENTLIIEDVVTTGLSTKEVMEEIKPLGAIVKGIGCLVDRSGGNLIFGVPLFSLLTLDVKSFKADECLMCKSGHLPFKPGSRN